MLLAEDESIWGVADRKIQGQGENVWLRKIAKPDTCQGYRKLYHGYRIRLVLTEEGNLFVNGSSEEVRGFNAHEYLRGESEPDYQTEFK